jgi:hypothetical protein
VTIPVFICLCAVHSELRADRLAAVHVIHRTALFTEIRKRSQRRGGDEPDDAEDLEEGPEGWGTRLWNALVDMDAFWTHMLLAVLECAGGTGLTLFAMYCLQAPMKKYDVRHFRELAERCLP